MKFVIRSFTIDPEAAKLLDSYSRKSGLPRSLVIRQLIAQAARDGKLNLDNPLLQQ
jgi:hypothetical protein